MPFADSSIMLCVWESIKMRASNMEWHSSSWYQQVFLVQCQEEKERKSAIPPPHACNSNAKCAMSSAGKGKNPLMAKGAHWPVLDAGQCSFAPPTQEDPDESIAKVKMQNCIHVVLCGQSCHKQALGSINFWFLDCQNHQLSGCWSPR